MRRKVLIGLALFVAGILLDIVHETTDIWILGMVAYILWPIGMTMGINALILLKNKGKRIDTPHSSTKNRK